METLDILLKAFLAKKKLQSQPGAHNAIYNRATLHALHTVIMQQFLYECQDGRLAEAIFGARFL